MIYINMTYIVTICKLWLQNVLFISPLCEFKYTEWNQDWQHGKPN